MAMMILIGNIERRAVVHAKDESVLDVTVDILHMLRPGTIVTIMCSPDLRELVDAWRAVIPVERSMPPDSKRQLVESLRGLGWITTASIVESYALEELKELAALADQMLNGGARR